MFFFPRTPPRTGLNLEILKKNLKKNQKPSKHHVTNFGDVNNNNFSEKCLL